VKKRLTYLQALRKQAKMCLEAEADRPNDSTVSCIYASGAVSIGMVFGVGGYKAFDDFYHLYKNMKQINS